MFMLKVSLIFKDIHGHSRFKLTAARSGSRGTLKLHKEGNKVACVHAKTRVLVLNNYPDPPLQNSVSAPVRLL